MSELSGCALGTIAFADEQQSTMQIRVFRQ